VRTPAALSPRGVRPGPSNTSRTCWGVLPPKVEVGTWPHTGSPVTQRCPARSRPQPSGGARPSRCARYSRVDRPGGESRPEVIIDLVRSGRLDEARTNASARRLLTVTLQLCLFDDPFVDPDEAGRLKESFHPRGDLFLETAFHQPSSCPHRPGPARGHAAVRDPLLDGQRADPPQRCPRRVSGTDVPGASRAPTGALSARARAPGHSRTPPPEAPGLRRRSGPQGVGRPRAGRPSAARGRAGC